MVRKHQRSLVIGPTAAYLERPAGRAQQQLTAGGDHKALRRRSLVATWPPCQLQSATRTRPQDCARSMQSKLLCDPTIYSCIIHAQ